MKKKALYKKWMSMLLAGMITSTGFMGGTVTLKAAETTSWIGDEGLSGTASAPEADTVVPDNNQFRYQKEELAAFCHFGPNTFNEIEWGEHYGNKKPSEIFTLKNDFDAETLVNTLKDAGFKKLIVTAKHHDGFCIWDSAYTEYDVKAAGYKDANGNSDILAEISEACTKANMDMGLYLSPWDIHDSSYGYKDKDGKPLVEEVTVNGKKENRPIGGHDWEWVYANDAKDYNEYYNNQLEEILSNPKYGNNGKFVEVWMDGAKGGGSNYQEYTFKKWFDTIQKYEGKGVDGRDADCMLFGADAYTTVRWIGNENGLAAKDTWSKSKVDDKKTTIDSNNIGGFTAGFEDGNQWTVPEADARITSGWFWGTQKNTPKSMEELSNMYFNSVGHNATLLLNVPPNAQGTVDEPILKRIEEFGNNIKNTFATNLAKSEGASVKVSSVRGNAETFKPGNMIDVNDDTYWTTDDGTNKAEVLIDLGKKKNFDVVSIEEAIQNGQRINQYKVEYREGTEGAWTLLEEGTTIGAKRLCRASDVAARQIKITVSTPDGKVPMISEVGVYKSTPDMEKPNPIPKGMETIDITDKDVSDGKGFTFKGKWNPENQPQYINGTNTWANAGAELELKFHGTKAYLLGTVDPGHGKVEITVDDGEKVVVDTKAAKRATGQRWFETKDLEDGDHTIKLKVVGNALGIEAASVINNGGKGMIQLEENSYTMNESEKKELKVKRVGGTEGKVTARLQPNPGTAIQGDFNTDLNPEIVFENGVSETTAAVETRRNPDKTGDRDFTVEITDVKGDVILGFNKRAKITIKDMEGSESALSALVKECESYKKDWFISGWDVFDVALKNAKAIAEKEGASPEEMKQAETALTEAKNGLVKREKYTSENPFNFPGEKDSSATLEAEFAELHNTGNNEEWPLKITEAAWASNKKFVNCLNGDDTITIPYKVEKPGTYKVTLTYRSGSDTNSLAWSDDAKNIKPGSVVAGNSDPSVTKTKEFEIVAEKAGAGILTLKGDTKDAPQLDKFDIILVEENVPAPEVNKDELKTVIKEAEGKLVEVDQYTEETVNALKEAVAQAQDVLNNTKATQTEVNEAVTVVQEAIKNLAEKPTVQKEFTISAIAYGGGSIDPSGAIKVQEGKDQLFTIQPNEGFEVKDVQVNGESVGVVTEYTFQGTMADATIEVYFVEKEGVQADKTKLNASIAAAEELLKHAEEYVSEDIVNLKSVLDDAKMVLEDTAVNQEAVDAAHKALNAAMNITPIQNEFTIMAEASEGGTITPAGEVKVQKDTDQTFIIRANEGYEIKDVLVNGESVGVVTEYVFHAVNEEASIKAIFQKAVVATDKTKLTTVIDEAEALLAQTDKYTEESVQTLRKEVESAQLILAKEEATQDEIDAAVDRVKMAIESLKEKPQNPDTNKPDVNKPENPDTGKPDVNKPDTTKPQIGNNSGSGNHSTTQKPSSTTKREIAKTGDTTAVAGVVATGIFAGGGAALLAFMKRRRQNLKKNISEDRE